jgi:hypothetical protein
MAHLRHGGKIALSAAGESRRCAAADIATVIKSEMTRNGIRLTASLNAG